MEKPTGSSSKNNDKVSQERKKLEGRFVISQKLNNGIEKRKRNHYNPSLAEIRDHFHIPLSEAARGLNVCSTKLKKLCREYGILKWPYRKVCSSIFFCL